MTPNAGTKRRSLPEMASARPSRWHQLHAEEVLRLLEVDVATGLASGEAERRLAK
ncbi:MAG: hypothetical protein DVB31_13580, partial [Verrucomicrobia bacterium]